MSERLGHSSVAFTIQVYQHVLPGLQADVAATFGELVFGPSWSSPADRSEGSSERAPADVDPGDSL